MKRTTLLGTVAAGLMAAAAATPAWSQATTYPEGTDCAAIENSASRTECMSQMNESRQNPEAGDAATGDVSPDANPNAAPGSADQPQGNQGNQGTGNAPDNSQGTGAGNGTNGNNNGTN